MIHVCFALYDGTGTYSRFTGTAMLSLFENANNTPPHLPSITVHLLHDHTLTDDNRDKFNQIADRYGQQLKFYNVEERCTDRYEQINVYFPDIYADRHSIAMFYRFFIPDLLLPQEIEKAIYLDSDIIVNLDIAEFWQIELGDKPFGAIPEVFQFNDKDVGIKAKKRYMAIVNEGVVNPEEYLNSGVLLMNLKVLSKEEDTILTGMKFISEHPQFEFLDQDILNYCFSTSYLKLPLKFNRFVFHARPENEWTIEKKIYHFAASRISFIMDSRDLFNRLFMDYFIKTPWVDADTKVALSGGLPSRKYHTISVVVPMYNAEEFIAECLESLLIQTFQDFEVIVVDDCSTDNSRAIVESYMSKFNGRLTLTKMEKNSGGGGNVPRNIGIKLARGEYIQFLDADDMLLGNALETFYSAATFYDADIVYTSSCYVLKAPDDAFLYKDGTSRKMPNIQTNLTIDDPNTNLSRLLLEPGEGNFRNCWTKFIRREFLLENKIFFPNLSNAGDFIGVINIYCYARRFLRIATPLYLHRQYNNSSILRTVREPREQCLYWFSTFVDFTKALYELERENKVLAENPEYCLGALRGHFAWCLNRTEEARRELDNEKLYKILHEEFAKKYSYSSALLLPFLFNAIHEKEVNGPYYVKVVNKFKRYLTARIDVKLMTIEGEFQILSVADDKASISKPSWLQKNGIGYVIQSYAGELNFTAKATVDGKIQLLLRGIDIRNPEDKTKRIPYWIDYTKLTINGKTIFDTLTPTWHNEPHRYDFDVKAGEEIKIQVEWQPHRSDT
ncbi:MAG: glycosyltransferase [Quinella sp. 1Q5]|nr:glycosyltransferase [Quinella sp. 1Q5]